MNCGKNLIWLISLSAMAANIGAAQSLTKMLQSAAPKPQAAAAPVDPLGRGTPRTSISNFLEACHRSTLARAAQYLDLSQISSDQRADEGQNLARTVCFLLNRDTQFELRHLSDSAEGMPDDGLEPDRDLLATFQLNGETVPLYLQRENRKGVEIWLVSADSVAQLPKLAPLTQETAFERWLPAPLVKIRFIGTSVWVWIVLIVIASILGAFSRLLSRAVLAGVRPFIPKRTVLIHRLGTLIEPIRLLVAVLIFRIAINFVPTTVLLRQYLLYLLMLLFVIGVAALIMRIADVISDRIQSRMDPKQRAVSLAMFRLTARFIKICIFCIAVLFLLHQWGFQIGAILAGLGVGGLAVALAAQKTIENLFGGISIISDRPVAVGDFCLFTGPRGEMVGTVVDVGLRSTRIRTLDRTMVTIPNANFATMSIENFVTRDMMWFHPTLQLRRDTPPAKIRAMMDAMVKILKDHPLVDPTDVPLRFSAILNQSFQLEIFAYVKSDDYNKFLNVQSELFLKFLEAGEELGVSFAVPFYEITPGKQLAQEGVEAFFSRLEAGENGHASEERGATRQERT